MLTNSTTQAVNVSCNNIYLKHAKHVFINKRPNKLRLWHDDDDDDDDDIVVIRGHVLIMQIKGGITTMTNSRHTKTINQPLTVMVKL